MRADLIHSDVAGARQQRQTDGADARIKLGDSGTVGNLRTQVLDDVLRDLEVVLPESTRRVVHRRSAKPLHDADRPAPVLEVGTENGVGSLAMRIEPQAVQL